MKYIITEQQYRLLTEDKIYKVDFSDFNNDWDILQRHLEKKKNPPYVIIGNLNLSGTDIKTLGSLVGVEGSLYLGYNKRIEDLGNLQYVGGSFELYKSNIKSLGNLESVGGWLDLRKSNIESLGNLESVGDYLSLGYTNIESLGNLEYVGGYLDLRHTPLSKTTTKEEIRRQVKVEGEIVISIYRYGNS